MRRDPAIQIERQPQLPLSKAFKISMESVRIRFWRSMITAGGVFLGIAFLSSVLITEPLDRNAAKEQAVRQGTMKKVYTANSFKGHKVILDGNTLLIDGQTVTVNPDETFAIGTETASLNDVRGEGSMRYQRTVVATKSAQDKEDEAQQRARRNWLAVMSLLVCGVGIANAMLMSVTERFKEIGTMKCLGALDKFVVELFLLEAMFLGILASLLGAFVGTVAMAVGYWAREGFIVIAGLHGMDVLAVAGKSMAVGTFLTVASAIVPALRAASLPPASALRSEI